MCLGHKRTTRKETGKSKVPKTEGLNSKTEAEESKNQEEYLKDQSDEAEHSKDLSNQEEYLKDRSKVNLSTKSPEMFWVGAHVSAAKGVHNAFHHCKAIGGKAFALFLKSQRKWESPPLAADEIERFKETFAASGLDPHSILPHGSYLINLGNPDEEKRSQSLQCFLDDVQRCEALGVRLYNFHPGSTVGACSPAQSIRLIADGIDRAHGATQKVILVLETMAGQGNVIGSRFEELAEIIRLVKDKSRVGVCLDTCHIYAAGYDIRSAKAYEKTMSKFEEVVGLEYLRAVHLNDSKDPLGSRRDRHERIGKGRIGLAAFRHLMNDPRRFSAIPLILETPLGEGEDADVVYAQEVQLLYSLVGREEED